MGKQKYMKDVEDLFVRSPIVSYGSIERIIKNKKNVKQYTKQLVRNLLLKGKIKRLAKGYYTRQENILLSVFCFKPSYLGLQDAMSTYNLWEQETIPVIITTRKIRPGIRKILGLNVLIKRIQQKYFFGINYIKSGDFYFPYSDIEKTLIDMVYFKQHMDKEVLDNFRRRINKRKIKNYLKKYPKRTSNKILKLINKNK